VVSLSWRARRAQLMQREVANYMMANRQDSPQEQLVRKLLPKDQPMIESPRSDPQFTLGKVLLRDWANELVLDRMNRYEKRIEASLYRTLNEFSKWRMIRKLEAVEAEADAGAPGEDDVSRPSCPRFEGETPATRTGQCAKQSQFGEAAGSGQQGKEMVGTAHPTRAIRA
jgi:hypothetical protein